MRRILLTLAAVAVALSPAAGGLANDLAAQVDVALERAGDNRAEIENALQQVPDEQRPAMQFLIAYMPQRDLTSLSSARLVENVQLAYRAYHEAPWREQLPEAIFLNDVLPYASINEQRDDWRADFYQRFKPLVKDATSPSEAAAILNQQIFPLLQVKYSTKRRRADQGPHESMESGLASCTGLSILLIDACRAVGVPARFVGTPLWTNKSGNHSWVEVWDNGWHFTGAAEPTGDELDKGWFVGRAATAQRDHPLHAIYAVSYRRTPQRFPLVWDRSIDYVYAVNVTDRYTKLHQELPPGHVEVQFRAIDVGTGDRCAAPLVVRDAGDKVVFEGTTKDERFDANDHLSVALQAGKSYRVEAGRGEQRAVQRVTAAERDVPITLRIDAPQTDRPPARDSDSQSAVTRLKAYLAATPGEGRTPIADESFASVPLTREDAAEAQSALWADHVATLRRTRADEMEVREIRSGDLKMPFHYEVFGEKPERGRSLFLSLHGGGGTTRVVNDRQWENQKRLYTPSEGVYLAPRAPTDTWNLWHQGHIDEMFQRLIQNLIVFEDVNPDRVYVMGYSAGGDGVYQLAPRMADRWAAAAMMAGHPNDTSPLGLRNIAFTLHMGGRDKAYQRNEVAAEWKSRLAELRRDDPDGYVHLAKIYPEKGHWLDGEDAAAVPWMAQFDRDPFPRRIVWKQDDVVHTRFYWLAMVPARAAAGTEIRADRAGQHVDVRGQDLAGLRIRLNDRMLNLDKPIRVAFNGADVFTGVAPRTIATLAKTLTERGDPRSVYSAEVAGSGL